MLEQKCVRCKVKMPVDEISIKYKFCDICKIEKRKVSLIKFQSKDPMTIKRLPKCQCGEILRRTSIQYHIKSKNSDIFCVCTSQSDVDVIQEIYTQLEIIRQKRTWEK